jgi:SRSO17 transposase
MANPRRVFISGQKRGAFGVIKRELRRRSAIEPVIGHMNTDGHSKTAILAAVTSKAATAMLSRFRRWCSRRLSGTARLKLGSSMTLSFPRKGRHSVGVARQYCGQLGKQDNCQVAVSLSIANHHASLPIAYRLYLPQSWAEEAERREKTGVPKDVVFKTKPEIALEQIRSACEADIEPGLVLMNAGYGADTTLRKEVTALELSYVAGILPNRPPGAC